MEVEGEGMGDLAVALAPGVLPRRILITGEVVVVPCSAGEPPDRRCVRSPPWWWRCSGGYTSGGMMRMGFVSRNAGGFGGALAPSLVDGRLPPTSRRIFLPKGGSFHSSRPRRKRGGSTAFRWSPWHGAMEVSSDQVASSPALATLVPSGSSSEPDCSLTYVFEVLSASYRDLFVIFSFCWVLM